MGTKVRDLVANQEWLWPNSWFTSCLGIEVISMPVFWDNEDKLWWLSNDNRKLPFSVHNAWDSLKDNRELVAWFRVVWFSQCIPKHVFMLWIVMHKRLKTQDRLQVWDGVLDVSKLRCFLCNQVLELYNHLFFVCCFAKQVWKHLLYFAKLDKVTYVWDELIEQLRTQSHRNTIWSIIRRILLGAVVYHLWRERNRRLHKKINHYAQDIARDIVEETRLKLSSIKTKPSARVNEAVTIWSIASWHV